MTTTPTPTPTFRKTNLTLPPEVSEQFDRLDYDPDSRNEYIAALRQGGWTLQSIASATGLTRERVRQIALDYADAPLSGVVPDVPLPPVHVVKPKPVYIEPDPAKLARMLELQDKAQRVRANSPHFREEAEEYTRLIWESHTEDKVTLYRLAKRLGVTHGALRFRLARYGYLIPPNAESKVYTPILEKNRAV